MGGQRGIQYLCAGLWGPGCSGIREGMGCGDRSVMELMVYVSTMDNSESTCTATVWYVDTTAF